MLSFSLDDSMMCLKVSTATIWSGGRAGRGREEVGVE